MAVVSPFYTPKKQSSLITGDAWKSGKTEYKPSSTTIAQASSDAGLAAPVSAPQLADYYIEQPQKSITDYIAELQASGILQPQTVTGLGEDVFEQQAKQSREALLDQYFGMGGLYDVHLGEEGAAGMLESGVAKRRLAQQITSPFAKAAADIESTKMTGIAEEASRVSETNANLKSNYDQLMSTIATAASANDLANIEKQIALYEADLAGWETEKTIGMEEAQIPVPVSTAWDKTPLDESSENPGNVVPQDWDKAKAAGYKPPPPSYGTWELVYAFPGDPYPYWYDSNSGTYVHTGTGQSGTYSQILAGGFSGGTEQAPTAPTQAQPTGSPFGKYS